MLDQKGFDLWADGYDRTVGLSDEENTYPFAGYKEVLGKIYRTVMEKENARVVWYRTDNLIDAILKN